jgi:uncharacterized protein (TIGR03086 family)
MHMPTTSEPDIRELDARAVRATLHLVAGVTRDDLDRPTPCAGWTLTDLLAHMAAQHRGFAAAAAGGGADLAVWQPRPADDPVPAYLAAAEQVITAFAQDGVLEREFAIPEITTRMTFPGARAISFHFIDYVVHGWDVARSLGVRYELPADLVAAAVPVARAVPDGPERAAPGAAFRPGLPVPDGAAPMEEILTRLGRDPDWSA